MLVEVGDASTTARAGSRILRGLRARASALALVTVWLVTFLVGTAALRTGTTAMHAFTDLGWTLSSALAAYACARAARHTARPGRRKAWLAFALGTAGWTLGMLHWSYLELVRGVTTPFPALADIGFLALPVGFAVGLFFYGADAPGARSTLKQIGDLGIVLATIGLCACFVFAEAIREGHFSLLYGVVALGYPVLHLSLLFFSLTALWSRTWQPQSARVVGLLVAATLVLALVTTFYAQTLLLAAYEVGHLMDPLWPLAFALVYVAAAEEQRRDPVAVEEERVRVTLGDVLVPPVCIATTVLVGYAQGFDVRSISGVLCVLGVALAIALGVRSYAQRAIEAALREEVRAREQQFVAAQRMEAVAALAGGLAHDFNNLLTGVLGGVGMLRHAERTGKADPSHLDLVEQSAQRAADLTKRLLVFARRRDVQRAPMQPFDVMRRAAMLVRAAAPDNVVVREEGAHRGLTVVGDASQLEHALVNLGLNAVHAMPLGGQLRFALDVVEEADGAMVCFSVRDTGVGIPEHVRARIFEPFYSTRAPGEGTGLGLAMVRSAALAHDGRVELESRVGEGTTFRVLFPAVEATSGVAPAAVPASAHANAGETVLVVDDRGVALLAAQAMLESAGYRVLATSRVADALALADVESIDAMLIDIIMPDTDGFEVAAQLRMRLTGVPVVLATGHVPPSSLPAWVSSVVEKPYRPKTLAAAIRRAIDESRVTHVETRSGAA